MTDDLTLFHTASVHRTTFTRIAARIAPGVQLTHVVRPDWLERAQGGIDATLSAEIQHLIAQSPNALCSCTTIGEEAALAGALRIDQPMMDLAASTGGPVLMAYCLDSTLEPSRALLTQAFTAADKPAAIQPLPLTDLWPLFASGQTDQFAQQIAQRIDAAVEQHPTVTCVVLAQASMAAAAQHTTANVRVLSSPELALRAGLGLPLK
ncbi:hypothetical protein [Phaeobacter sp. NW0010-22]|uniref:hypothetical protein n=1 Tax=Phaeobacter sp. NW0010-22 TaxID=3135907 RepID=UPI00310B2E40